MKKRVQSLTFLFVLCCYYTIAQNINVDSFRLLDNDLTANTTGSIERDQNGEIAALIKVVTTEQGFVFDGGMTGIVKTKQEVGEVWVYVPHGIKKVTIKHPQLGVLRDYFFPIAIDKAKTYEMVLNTGKVETVVTRAINKQFVIFKVSPSNAVVELGDDMLSVDSEGYVEKGVPFGTYSYRVSCEDYYTEAGQIVVNDQGKVKIDISLRPKFGWIKFEAIDEYHGAYVYVDNKRVGQLPLKTEGIKSGTHQIKIAKSLYKTYEQQVTIVDNEVLPLNVRLTPNFANITLNSDAESEIWLDGELKGKGSWTGALEIGEYKVETKKESHRTRTEIVQITNLASRTIQLPAPTPIYGSAEITSSPTNVTVLIDGIEMGKTPLIINNVLIGVREFMLKKEGYEDNIKRMEIKELIENKISFKLEQATATPLVTITSNAKRADVLIDGKYMGRTPLTTPIQVGEKFFVISKEGYSSFVGIKEITAQKENNLHFDLQGYPISYCKRENRNGIMLGLDLGYSNYGYNYGGDIFFYLNSLSVHAGMKNHIIGKYFTYNGCVGGKDDKVSHSIQLLRISTKLGYTFPLNTYFLMTPQLGLVYAPMIGKGYEYIKGEVPILETSEVIRESQSYLYPDMNYSELNSNILKFANSKFRYILGVRFEVLIKKSKLGFHVTPEYIASEGFSMSTGIMMNLY